MIATAPAPHPVTFLESARLGRVTIPPAHSPGREAGFSREEARELLLTLGQNLGLQAQAPLDGENAARQWDLFSEPALRLAFEGLDLVWMDEAGPVAVFALEPGDAAWEGPRRLADLLALHPKLKASLFVVTMPGLRESLAHEFHRPIYHLLKRPLAESVRVLDWPRLLTEVTQIGDRARYLKPDFLNGVSDAIAGSEDHAN